MHLTLSTALGAAATVTWNDDVNRTSVAGGALPSSFLMTDGDLTYFKNIPVKDMDGAGKAAVLTARTEYKAQLFGESIKSLEVNPNIADVKQCATTGDALVGKCLLTQSQQDELIKSGAGVQALSLRADAGFIPQIERKRALVIGLNKYRDKRIPQLVSAVPDAKAVGKTFADELGYEVTLLENASKTDLIAWFNRLSVELRPSDSLVVFFAGHGEVVQKTNLGYWIPSDASASDPSSWVSNADVSRWLSNIQAKQVAVVSDSCYSGTFAAEKALDSDPAGFIKFDELLAKRTVTVMTSGSDEPVSDTGNNGHSVFAWSLMQEIKKLGNWSPGASIFATVQKSVTDELPQTPQYGAALSAGHQSGGEFLFERRSVKRN